VRVVRATSDSPAERAGLRPGDRIVRIDDKDVSGLEEFYTTLWRGGPEREITLIIDRAGAQHTLRLLSQDRMKTLRRAKGI